ncbi:hypothetical protein BDW74DRAFT_180996 [Aspergillus multicolor]|uniref:uncharacterized protein n=1 Tax=Aspergillus multicolor TaxID=41759 RepID=UPI003CCC9F83
MSTIDTSSAVSSSGVEFRLMDLPTELIIMVAENTSTSRDLLYLCRSSKFMYGLLTKRLVMINVDHQSASGLNYAVRKNNIPLAGMFLDAGADINKASLTVKEGRMLEQETWRDICKRVEDLAERDKHAFGALSEFRQSGRLDTPLYVAVSHGFEAMVYFLLVCGADPKTAAARGYPSALAKASYDWNEPIMRLLIRALKGWGVPKKQIKEEFCINTALGGLDRGLI